MDRNSIMWVLECCVLTLDDYPKKQMLDKENQNLYSQAQDRNDVEKTFPQENNFLCDNLDIKELSSDKPETEGEENGEAS